MQAFKLKARKRVKTANKVCKQPGPNSFALKLFTPKVEARVDLSVNDPRGGGTKGIPSVIKKHLRDCNTTYSSRLFIDLKIV